MGKAACSSCVSASRRACLPSLAASSWLSSSANNAPSVWRRVGGGCCKGSGLLTEGWKWVSPRDQWAEGRLSTAEVPGNRPALAAGTGSTGIRTGERRLAVPSGRFGARPSPDHSPGTTGAAGGPPWSVLAASEWAFGALQNNFLSTTILSLPLRRQPYWVQPRPTLVFHDAFLPSQLGIDHPNAITATAVRQGAKAPRRQGALAPAQFEIIVVAQAIAQRTGANADRCQGAALAGTTPDPRVHRRTVRQCAHDFSRRASLTRTLNRLASGTLITASLATRRGAKTPH